MKQRGGKYPAAIVAILKTPKPHCILKTLSGNGGQNGDKAQIVSRGTVRGEARLLSPDSVLSTVVREREKHIYLEERFWSEVDKKDNSFSYPYKIHNGKKNSKFLTLQHYMDTRLMGLRVYRTAIDDTRVHCGEYNVVRQYNTLLSPHPAFSAKGIFRVAGILETEAAHHPATLAHEVIATVRRCE